MIEVRILRRMVDTGGVGKVGEYGDKISGPIRAIPVDPTARSRRALSSLRILSLFFCSFRLCSRSRSRAHAWGLIGAQTGDDGGGGGGEGSRKREKGWESGRRGEECVQF